MSALTGIAAVLTSLAPQGQPAVLTNADASLSLFEAARPRKHIDAERIQTWKLAMSQKFNRLRSLHADWAGPVCEPISSAAIFKASRVMDLAMEGIPDPILPAVVPVADGGLQLEWHTADYDLEVYFGPDDSVTAIWEDRTSGFEAEKDGNAALDLFFGSVARLAQRPNDANNEGRATQGPVFEFAT